MVRTIRTVESALGNGRKEPASSEANTATVVRKSLVASHDIAAGSPLDQTNVSARRPGTGLSPARFPEVLGRVAKVAIPAGKLIELEMLV
jgi:sialic acid synthase SpsE